MELGLLNPIFFGLLKQSNKNDENYIEKNHEDEDGKQIILPPRFYFLAKNL